MPPRKNAAGRWEWQHTSPRNGKGEKVRLYVVCPPAYNTPAFCREKMRAEIERHMGMIPKKATTFGAFVREKFLVEYPAARNLRPSSRGLLHLFLEKTADPDLGGLSLSAIDAAAVARLCARLQTEIRPGRQWKRRPKTDRSADRRRYSDRTIRHVVVAIISVLRWAKKAGEIAAVPEIVIPKVADAKRPAPYSDEEACALIASADDPEERLLFLLTFDGGIRKSEALGLTWEQVDFARHVMLIDRQRYRGTAQPTKSGHERRVPLSTTLETELRAFRHLRGPLVLCDADGRARTEDWVRAVATRCRKRAKLRHARWHDGRHHFSTRLTEAGVSLFALRELLGHVDVKTTQGYVHAATAQLGSVLDAKGSS